MRFLPLVIVVAIVFSGNLAPGAEVTGVPRIIDGNTLEIDDMRIRLHGIDAPETGQQCQSSSGNDFPCGEAAAEALRRLVDDHSISCAGSKTDASGPLIAVCRLAKTDMNAEMVRRGWALAFVRYSDDYAAIERSAAKERRGLWVGTFEPPWEFRRNRWESASLRAPQPECPIKGNISKNGRIYHTPYSRDYDHTRINTARGERWFCSEADALAEGWRAPRY